MLLGFEFDSYFGTWEGSLVLFLLDTLAGLIIDTKEGYLVDLSLELPLESPIEPPNPGADLPDTLPGAPLGLCFVSNMVWVEGISCIPPSGAFITSKMNSVKYYKFLEFLTLSL